MPSKPMDSKSSYKTMDDIAAFIDGMKFKKKTFGGVDELDVLKQMEALQQVYRSVYESQAAYYQALIDERDAIISRLRRG